VVIANRIIGLCVAVRCISIPWSSSVRIGGIVLCACVCVGGHRLRIGVLSRSRWWWYIGVIIVYTISIVVCSCG